MAISSIFDPRKLGSRLAEVWARVLDNREEATATDAVTEKAIAEAPVIWMLGKVQSGKSSIVQAITGASQAEVGSGFRPCTRTARVFDFPAEAPVIRFLDTRGLGEVGYDPTEDVAVAEAKAHLLLVVMRAMDHQQADVIAAVEDVRRRRPDWPVVVAQTCLHDAYPAGQGHLLPYPFAGKDQPDAIPEALTRSLAHQRAAFGRVGGSVPPVFVPIDLTHPDDGFEPRLYGLDHLMAAISEAAPHSLAAMVKEIRGAGRERALRSVHPLILGYATAAAAADVVPIAGAVAVPGVQAKMLHALAAQSDVAWDRRALAEFGSCLGASVLTRLAAGFGIRQLAKLVPVYGQTVGSAAAAATSFATTYALGRAAVVFLARRQTGQSDPEAVSRTYKEALSKAFSLARERGLGQPASSDATPPVVADGPR